MRLTPAQLDQFDRDGYLFFPPLDLPWKDGVPASALQTSSVPFDGTRKAA
jgi:hypothetical protein